LPIDYRIHDRLLDTRASGVLDDETLVGYVRTVMADAAYADADADLFDARDVTDVRLTAEGMRSIATVIQQSGLSSKRVAVVATLPAMFGMARMFEMLRDDIEVRVFRDRDAALEWIGASASAGAPEPR
jgi:hypothetical protein